MDNTQNKGKIRVYNICSIKDYNVKKPPYVGIMF